MRLALFDLDNTLLAGDSDYEWGQFLVDHGVLERESYEAQNRTYYEQYVAGTLDIREYLGFALQPLAHRTGAPRPRDAAGGRRSGRGARRRGAASRLGGDFAAPVECPPANDQALHPARLRASCRRNGSRCAREPRPRARSAQPC